MKGSFPEFYTPPEGSTPLWSPYVTRMKGDRQLVAPLSGLPGGSLPPWVKPPSLRGEVR